MLALFELEQAAAVLEGGAGEPSGGPSIRAESPNLLQAPPREDVLARQRLPLPSISEQF